MPTPSTETAERLFFAGKGGVGKTTMAVAAAAFHAVHGRRTLLVTTDPAAHIGRVLECEVGDEPRPVASVPGLDAARIDPRHETTRYKDGVLSDALKRFSHETVQRMEEELNSPCTEEMAAFDKFIEYASEDQWEAVVFDTAPTGHTLRMLELPMDWSKQLDVKIFASVDTSAADDVAKQRFGKVIEMMRDPDRSTFAFVMYPEATPIIEAYRAAEELSTVGIHPGLVVANMVIPPQQANTDFTQARRTMQEKYLNEISERFHLPVAQIPLLPKEVKGLKMLSELGDEIYLGISNNLPKAE